MSKLQNQVAALGKGYGKLGYNYYCEKCNEYFRWAKLGSDIIREGDIVMMAYKTCPNCNDMVIDIKRKK